MPSATFTIFREAIASRQQVVCTYQSHIREVCPHTLGHKDGQEKALTFQFAGGSSTGLLPGGQWRCLFLAQVEDARLRSGVWHSGEGHSRPQTCVTDVDIEVDY